MLTCKFEENLQVITISGVWNGGGAWCTSRDHWYNEKNKGPPPESTNSSKSEMANIFRIIGPKPASTNSTLERTTVLKSVTTNSNKSEMAEIFLGS